MNAKILEPVKVRQIISASPEMVFDAWVSPEMIGKWLFVGPTSEIVNVNLDLRVQGKFSILEFEKEHQGIYRSFRNVY